MTKSAISSTAAALLVGIVFAWNAPATAQDESFDESFVVRGQDERTPVFRLAGVPNMFGDFLFNGGDFYVVSSATGRSTLPPIGGGRVKIAENNKALPMDRVFFDYSHFQDGIRGTGDLPSANVDRFTVGLEKTFRDGLWSVELRCPLMGSYDYGVTDFNYQEIKAGNLLVTLKRVIHETDSFVAAIGCALNTPTGGGAIGVFALQNGFALKNDALYAIPWVGCCWAPNDRLFAQAFVQCDIACNGDRMFVNNQGQGKYIQQNLMGFDSSVGYWLYQNPCADYINGIAGLLEFHYTTTMQDTNVLNPSTSEFMQLSNYYNRQDCWNVTGGLHFAIGYQTTFRVAGAVPITDNANRFFDSEFKVSVNRYF